MPTAAELLRKFKGVKTLPHVALRLSTLVSDETASMTQFEEVIRMDPTLVLRLLRMVNSPYYGLRQKVDSISRAVVFIGMKNLRNMIVIEALKGIFQNGQEAGIFSRRRLWLHCATVSICSQMVSERIFMQKGEDAFLCGILHDIGLILEEQVEGDRFTRACNAWVTAPRSFVEYERELIGTDHCTLGSLLARDWKFPLEVQETIRHHHDAAEDISPSSMTGIIQMAEYMVSKMDYTELTGMRGSLSPALSAHIRENLDEYRALGQDLPEEMKKAEDLYNR